MSLWHFFTIKQLLLQIYISFSLIRSRLDILPCHCNLLNTHHSTIDMTIFNLTLDKTGVDSLDSLNGVFSRFPGLRGFAFLLEFVYACYILLMLLN